ncbi:MAG TPA: hypothetical protein VI815_02500 [Candidatus Nanoarchaeia archaeon]|nr:hypothetical protein [Candidatus Nanoarchaeia archaeon]
MEVTIKNMPVLEVEVKINKKQFFFNLERDGNNFGVIKVINIISSENNTKNVFIEMAVAPEIAAIWNMTPENSQAIIQKNYPELHPLTEEVIKFLLKHKKLDVHSDFIDSFNNDFEPNNEILKGLTFVASQPKIVSIDKRNRNIN